MNRNGMTILVCSIVPSFIGITFIGCDATESSQDEGVVSDHSTLRGVEKKVTPRSGLGPGSFNLDSKADLGIFNLSASPTMTIRMSTGSGFNAVVAEGSGFCANGALVLDGDFDNDQLDDIACIEGTTIKVRKHNYPPANPPSPPDFAAATTWLTWTAMPTNSVAMVGDFTGYFGGSSRMDDLAFHDPASGDLWVAASTGKAFATPTKWLAGFCAGGLVYVGDFDGDALEDVACYSPADGTVKVARSTGTSFNAPTTWISSWCTTGGSIHVANFDGDSSGKDDLACVASNGTVSSVALSNGSAFVASANWLVSPGFGSDAGAYYAADYSGDGKYDLGFCDATNNSFKVALSTGSAFSQPTQWIAAGGIDCTSRIMPTGTRDGDTTAGPQGLAEWTFMVYMDGDNSLESDAWYNLNQMETAVASSKVNLVVLLDTSSTTNEFQGNCVYLKVTHGSHGPVLKNLGECNMGDWHTLTTFTGWATSQFPAKHYAISVWDHGGGWRMVQSRVDAKPVKDCCVDDHPGPNGGPGSITVAGGDWNSALQAMNSQIGRKWDLVGFDACNMGMWEVSMATVSYASYFVGSEMEEPGTGWFYDGFLVPLVTTPTMSAATLGGLIVSTYNYSSNATLSEIDLSKVSDLSTAISNLGTSLLANPSDYSIVDGVRSSVSSMVSLDSYGIDIGLLTSQLSTTTSLHPSIRTTSATVNTKLTAAVLQKQAASISPATGLDFYMPPLNGHTDSAYYTGTGAVWTSTQWDEFLKSYAP